MFQSRLFLVLASLVILLVGVVYYFFHQDHRHLPIVAIANYGPHVTLLETVLGIRQGLESEGFKDGDQIRIEVADVNFEPSLIPQMLAKLKAHRPAVLVAQATPVAQVAKGSLKTIPIVFADITDPVAAGLLKDPHRSEGNVTGSSDQQDLDVLLRFAKQLIPQAKRVGMLYATGEANDAAQVKMMESAAKIESLELLAVPVEQARDVPMRMRVFQGRVDFIYVGVSGPIQPSLPAIAAEADRMKIPVFNADAAAVKDSQVLGSFGVSYFQVGLNAAQLIAKILRGEDVSNLPPLYPSANDHRAFVSRKKAVQLGIVLPAHLDNLTVIE